MFSIRPALESDLESVVSVLREAADWLETMEMPMWPSSMISSERVRGELEEFFLASNGTEVVGVMKLQLEDQLFWPEVSKGEALFLHRLAVRRDFAGMGVSKSLLDFAVSKARSLGGSICGWIVLGIDRDCVLCTSGTGLAITAMW